MERTRLHGINKAKSQSVVYVYNKDKRTEPFVTDKQSIIIDAAVVHVYCCRLAWEQQNHDNNFHKGKYTLFTKKQHRQCFDICKL